MDRRDAPTPSGDRSMDSAAPLSLPNRRVHFWTPLGVQRFEVTEVRGRESISRPYCFRLKLRTDPTLPLDLDRLVGAKAQITFQVPNPNWLSLWTSAATGPTRDFYGTLTDLSFLGADSEYGHYSATLRPRVWKLGLNRRFRHFIQKTTKEIVTAVLGGLPVRWQLSGDADPRQYCVQYGESDLSFVSRLLEEDGLFYFFEHQYADQPTELAERQERLVITDSIDKVAGDSHPTHEFDSVGGGNRSTMRIRRWRETHRLVPDGVVSLDRNFQRPRQLVLDSHDLKTAAEDPPQQSDATTTDQPASAPPTVLRSTVTSYPSGVARRIDEVSSAGARDPKLLTNLNTMATSDARRRSGRLAFMQSGIIGAGDVATMSPGMKFQVMRDSVLDSHPYYITAIEHVVRLANPTRSGPVGAVFEYKNRFRCQVDTIPYQPARKTRKPRVDGVVTATVVADPTITDDDVCVDLYGRVKVRFPWQAEEEAPGCWIRVAQIWAGPRWGAFFWPRVNHEVLVAFEHGDPDRPLIVGSVYNADNLPPLPLPQYKLSGGIHSCTHKGDPTRQTSCVVFHDRPHEEYLQLHSETYHSLSCETETLKWAAGHDVTFKGHNWIFDLIGGSGGGGSDFTGYDGGANATFKKPDENEMPSVGEVFADLFAITNKGSTTYSVGDSYTKRFGRQFETYFGSNIWVGCDPVEFVEFVCDKMGAKYETPLLGFIPPLLFGAGGQGKTLFGGTHNLQFGTEAKIHQGKTINRSGPSPFCSDSDSTEGNSTQLDGPVQTICHILLAVILLMDLLMMLLTKAALSRDSKEWKRYLHFSEVWSLSILPRLQGLLEFISTESTELNELLSRSRTAESDAESVVEETARAVTVTDDAAEITREVAVDDAEVAADAVRAAASAASAAASDASEAVGADGAEASG